MKLSYNEIASDFLKDILKDIEIEIVDDHLIYYKKNYLYYFCYDKNDKYIYYDYYKINMILIEKYNMIIQEIKDLIIDIASKTLKIDISNAVIGLL